jgi:hypothetical protein
LLDPELKTPPGGLLVGLGDFAVESGAEVRRNFPSLSCLQPPYLLCRRKIRRRRPSRKEQIAAAGGLHSNLREASPVYLCSGISHLYRR